MDDYKTKPAPRYNEDKTIPVGNYMFTYIPEKTNINILPSTTWRIPEMEKKVWVLVKSGSISYEWKSFDADSWSVLTTSYSGLEGYLEIYKEDFVVGTFPKYEWTRVVLSEGKPE